MDKYIACIFIYKKGIRKPVLRGAQAVVLETWVLEVQISLLALSGIIPKPLRICMCAVEESLNTMIKPLENKSESQPASINKSDPTVP